MDDSPTITIKDVYTQVTALVGHMQAVDTRNHMADEIHQDHEARLRILERWRYSLPVSLLVSGGSALVAALALVRR